MGVLEHFRGLRGVLGSLRRIQGVIKRNQRAFRIVARVFQENFRKLQGVSESMDGV